MVLVLILENTISIHLYPEIKPLSVTKLEPFSSHQSKKAQELFNKPTLAN